MTAPETHDDDLLLVREVCALLSRVTGRAFTEKAFRIAKTRSAADNPLHPVETNPQRYRRGDVLAWQDKRPGTGGRTLPELPDLYNTIQAAAAAGVTLPAWRSAQRDQTKLNPAPKPVPVDRIPPEHRWAPFYEPDEVSGWARARTGSGNWGSHPNPEQAAEGKGWTATQCATAAGTSPENWRYRVRHDPDAPQAIDRSGRNLIWDPTAVQDYIDTTPGLG